ncbi:MAG: hypothetical protein SPL08_01375 [Pseudomonadota bacterium]|nr:hypothetical protein [Pseudomonadota bacterium]
MKKIIFFLILIFSFPVWSGDSVDLPSSCPEGGIKIGHVCCKDGYAASYRHDENGVIFEGYNHVSGVCGCPDGGKQSTHQKYACCKDGFRYLDYKKDYIAVDVKACGYPEGTYKPKGDREAICKDGYLYINKDDPWLEPDECGCPAGHKHKKGNEYSNGYCCKDGYELFTKDSYRINYEICGCPKGTKHVKYDICCLKDKQGYAIENPSMGMPATEKLNFQFCGCPENGQMKNIGLPLYICCKNGYKLDEETGVYSIRETLCDSKPSIIKVLLKKSIGL